MTLKSIIQVADWFFVHEGHKEPVIWPLAAWGLNENSEVVGLIGAFGREQGSKGETPSLSTVPAVPGRYLHRTQLTQQERELATKRYNLEFAPVT